MNKMSNEDLKVVNNFTEYFEHMQESKLLIGVGVVDEEEPEKVFVLNTAVAAILTILKGKEIEDYFS